MSGIGSSSELATGAGSRTVDPRRGCSGGVATGATGGGSGLGAICAFVGGDPLNSSTASSSSGSIEV
jgi:hypothetical protein